MPINPNSLSKCTSSVMSRNGFASSISNVPPEPCSGTVASQTLPGWVEKKTRFDPSGCAAMFRYDPLPIRSRQRPFGEAEFCEVVLKEADLPSKQTDSSPANPPKAVQKSFSDCHVSVSFDELT